MIAEPEQFAAPATPVAPVAAPEVDDNSTEAMQARADVKRWLSRIASAKRRWKPDFDRMKKNVEFATGLQWPNQVDIETDRYSANFTLGVINNKVASLYAKNPKAVATRRDRLDFSVWEGDAESLISTVQQAQQMAMAGVPVPPEAMALLQDWQDGERKRKLIDKFCETFRIVYQYQVDTQKPEFKEQMKQAVRRVITCGVAFARPVYCENTDTYTQPSTIDTKSSVQDRVARIKGILSSMEEVDIDDNSPQYQTLRSLMLSVQSTMQEQSENQLDERLEFDFPSATSIIVDERCRNLKDFVHARWIAVEYVLPVEEVNAIFGTKITVGTGKGDSGATEINYKNQSIEPSAGKEEDAISKKLVCLYELFDYNTRTRQFLCEGWKDYVLPPEGVEPAVSGFWPIFALTFNSVEVEVGTKASIYPPSDVQLVKSAQKEWNRTRQALRDQRNANAPKYLTRKGALTKNDIEKLNNAEPNSVIELEGVPPDLPIEKFITVFQMAAIDPRMYDTTVLEQDVMLCAGAQQANIGPAQPNVTATVGTIAEQSRLNVSASNIDDLDGFLSRIARAGGEMLLQRMSKETVMRIAGPGAVWPEFPETRQDFLNEVFVQVEAASSGRPNKAVDIQNFSQLAPLILQAGGNPIGVVEEGAKRLGDTIDVSRFFPLLPTAMPRAGDQSASAPANQGSPTNPSAPPDRAIGNESGGGLGTGSLAAPSGMESPAA